MPGLALKHPKDRKPGGQGWSNNKGNKVVFVPTVKKPGGLHYE
jgi:hypothetical protein